MALYHRYGFEVFCSLRDRDLAEALWPEWAVLTSGPGGPAASQSDENMVRIQSLSMFRRAADPRVRPGRPRRNSRQEVSVSLEAWGDEGNIGPEGYVSEERAEELFRAGAQAMREMLARLFEMADHDQWAKRVRGEWHPGWGDDPGRPDEVVDDIWVA